MNYFERQAAIALEHHSELTYEQLHRQVMLVLREVERDTRHEACTLASELVNKIMNIDTPKYRAQQQENGG